MNIVDNRRRGGGAALQNYSQLAACKTLETGLA
jgi:hypothetical protein